MQSIFLLNVQVCCGVVPTSHLKCHPIPSNGIVGPLGLLRVRGGDVTAMRDPRCSLIVGSPAWHSTHVLAGVQCRKIYMSTCAYVCTHGVLFKSTKSFRTI